MTSAVSTEDSPRTDLIQQVAMKRTSSRHRFNIVGLQFITVVVVLAVWELGSGSWLPELMVSRPSAVFPQLWSWIVDGTLLDALRVTFSNAAIGLVIGATLGILVGVLLGQSRVLGEVFEPFLTALYTLPKFALIPLFIMWVGIGSSLAILTSSVIAFFLVFFNTFFGIKDVRQSLVNSVRVMGGSGFQVLTNVRLPSALIWVVAGLKLAVPQAIVGVVVAEMLAGQAGLGYLVARNAGMFNSAGTFAALIALLVVGFTVDRLMSWATKKPLEWKESTSAM